MRKLFLLSVAIFAVTALWAYDFQSGDLYYNITSSSAPYTVEVTSSVTDPIIGGNYPGLTTITIPETVTHDGIIYSVTKIGDLAFLYCPSLACITIPNSITSIEYAAFSECYGLTSITIPNSVTGIGDYAFYGCLSLTSITIPNSVTSIEGSAFYGCSSLSSITIPNSVTSIGEGAFSGCSGLTSIAVESGNTIYDSRENCSAIIEIATNTLIAGCQNSIIPNSVTSIADLAFYGCSSLISITIPNSVTSIGYGTFQDCSSLTSITIPHYVTSIGELAFCGCSSLTSIVIPNSVTSIGDLAFSLCSSLTSIIVDSGNTTYDSRENCNAIIETATNTLIAGCKNTTIPNSVTSIESSAFYGCSSLTSITIPNSVTSIEYGTFQDCSSLTSITIPNSVTSIGDNAFSGCYSLSSITIPESVTSIGYMAFSGCSSLTTVICEAIKVLVLESFFYCGVFYGVPLSEATLYVHAQLLDDYKAAEQWKEFGTILPIEEEEPEDPEDEIELQDVEMTIIFTNSEDNNSEIHHQAITIKVPTAPTIAGFTFLYWQPVAEPITNVITIQAIYEANTPTSVEVYTNPANPAQKLLRNGQVYILQDGKTYTVMGAEIH